MSTLGDAADVNPVNSETQNAFLFPVQAMFRHNFSLAVKPASTPQCLVHTHTHKTWRDSLPSDMLPSAVSVLVVAQPSSEVPEGLTNYPVYVIYLTASESDCSALNIIISNLSNDRSKASSKTIPPHSAI